MRGECLLSALYLYADEVSREVLRGDLDKVILLGGDFGYGNFGDIMQHANGLRIVKDAKRFATVSILAANAIGFKDFPTWARKSYGADAIIYVSDYPLILDGDSPGLNLLVEVNHVAAIYMYGGGFLNSKWGDFVLGVAEYFLRLMPNAEYLVSGQQVTHPYQLRVAQHIRSFKPTLFGVRDEMSYQWLQASGADALFSFDDATEPLVDLASELRVQPGPGVLLHLNSSGYSASEAASHAIADDMARLRRSAWGQSECTIFQAFRDPRHEVHDSRETVKKLDQSFPFYDLRTIELAQLAYPGLPQALERPIVGNMAYSCSYHVALWLQLAGIPCWLRSENLFYSQKSKALQVNQSLEDFLEAPSLADHRVNLERRQIWLHTLRMKLDELPAQRGICRIPQKESGPLSWPFFYKGRPSIDERLADEERRAGLARDHAQSEIGMLNERIEALSTHITEVGRELHQQRMRAEAVTLARDHAQSEVSLLGERVEALSALITEVGNELHQHRERAEVAVRNWNTAQLELERLTTSRSWKITMPLRALMRYVRYGHFDTHGLIGLRELIRRVVGRISKASRQ